MEIIKKTNEHRLFNEGIWYDLRYPKLLNKFADMFGKENMFVRLFENTQLINNSIFDDFLSIIEIENIDIYSNKNIDLNNSLSNDALEFKRLLNTVCTPEMARETLSNLMIDYTKFEYDNLSC